MLKHQFKQKMWGDLQVQPSVTSPKDSSLIFHLSTSKMLLCCMIPHRLMAANLAEQKTLRKPETAKTAFND